MNKKQFILIKYIINRKELKMFDKNKLLKIKLRNAGQFIIIIIIILIYLSKYR